jgi:hypothetical protein
MHFGFGIADLVSANLLSKEEADIDFAISVTLLNNAIFFSSF